MAKSIACLKSGSVEKVSMIDPKVIEKVSEDHYIVSDGKDHIVLVSEQKLQKNSSYKLIKPSYTETELRKNPKFAVVKIEKEIKTKVLKNEERDNLLRHISREIVKNEIKNDFEFVDALGVGGIASEIKLLVVTRSSVIPGKFGNYRIVTCKDIKNQKNNINLYKDLGNNVQVGEIYQFTQLKVNNYKRDEDNFNRIGTTGASRIIQASEEDKILFKNAKVTLGDNNATGIIIGISELNIYNSCIECWCKVEENNLCGKCDKKVENTMKNFNLAMYVQLDDNEDEIVNLFGFKSTLALEGIENMEITEENLNKVMIGRKCEVDYSIDKDGDEEKFRLMKIHFISA